MFYPTKPGSAEMHEEEKRRAKSVEEKASGREKLQPLAHSSRRLNEILRMSMNMNKQAVVPSNKKPTAAKIRTGSKQKSLRQNAAAVAALRGVEVMRDDCFAVKF